MDFCWNLVTLPFKCPVVGGMTFADISIRIEIEITQISASKPALQARWRSGGHFLPKNGHSL